MFKFNPNLKPNLKPNLNPNLNFMARKGQEYNKESQEFKLNSFRNFNSFHKKEPSFNPNKSNITNVNNNNNNKVNRPCFFYNTGGCFHKNGFPKKDNECKYMHVKVDYPMEKGQHLRAPCKYFHLGRMCKNPSCMFGHTELSYEKWNWYFPNHFYPGKEYTVATPGCQWLKKLDFIIFLKL